MTSVEGCPLQLSENNCGMVALLENTPRDATYAPEDMRGCNVAECDLPSIKTAINQATIVSQERAQGPDFSADALVPYDQLLLPPDSQRPTLGDQP